MKCSINELFSSEVINVCDGRRLGCVCDAEIDISCGRLLSIAVPAEQKLFSFGHEEVIVIPWDNITRIGGDVILVNCNDIRCRSDDCGGKPKKRGGMF